MTYDATTVATLFGPFTVIAEEGCVVRSGFTEDPESLRDCLPEPGAEIRIRDDLGEISAAIRAYLSGADLRALDRLPVRAAGSPAMQRLWAELRHIPAGEVRSYAQLGGERRYARVAGAACARNPIPVIVPCHRVVRTDGSLGGFASDIGIKRWLLDHEGAVSQLALVAIG